MMRALWVVTALAAAVPAALPAQGRRILTGFEYRSVSFDSGLSAKSVRLLAVPMGVVLPFSQRFQMDFGTYYAQAERTDDAGNATTLSGLTDVQARAVLELVPDAVVFTLSANLPTGHATLEGNELDVAGAVASDLIPFAVSNFGSGFSMTSGLALAMPVGAWAFGLAGSYRLNGEFQPLADTSAMYKPGGEMRVRFGVDRLIGQGRFSLGFTWSDFSTDEFGGSGAYRSGARYIPQLTLSLPLGNSNLSLYAWDIYRAQGEYVSSTTVAPKQNTLALGAVLSLPRGRSVFRPAVELRQAWEGDSSMANVGTLVGLTARYQMPLGGRLTLSPSARFDVGSIADPTGTKVSFTGFSAGIALATEW